MSNYLNKLYLVCFILLALFMVNSQAQERRFNNCLKSKSQVTLLDTLLKAMQKPIEDEYKYHDYIQTFGCAYEEDDVEQNSIRAVYRAIIQSARNRKVTFRDDLETILLSKPPRPDNLARDFSIYVNIPTDGEPKAAHYEIKILDLETVPTIESSKAVWARIVTRYAYKEDFNIAPEATFTLSEFVNIMQKASEIMAAVEKTKFGKLQHELKLDQVGIAYPTSIDELVFGDSFLLFDELNPYSTYPGVYLGKGIYICETPDNGAVVTKFGEERLYRLRIDNESYRRTIEIFAELNYQAPESVLQCLFVKSIASKPEELPQLERKD